MVRKQAPRVAAELESRYNPLEDVEASFVVGVVDCYGGASDAANEDVMRGAGVVVSQGSSHGPTLADT